MMLEVSNVTKRLSNGKTLLDEISFTIREGEFVGILGPSGAGKTLTIRCLIGLTRPDSGEVRFRDREGKSYVVTRASGKELRHIRRQIAVVFQGFHLVRRLTVLENVLVGRLGRIHPLRSWLYGFTDREAEEAMAALERVGMLEFAARLTGTLSGGEMQRVAIARAIFQKPALYLADEPIASLDPKNSEAILRLLAPLARESAVAGAFHQPDFVRRYCTRAIALRGGKIVYDGSPDLSPAQLAEIYGDSLHQSEPLPDRPAASNGAAAGRPMPASVP